MATSCGINVSNRGCGGSSLRPVRDDVCGETFVKLEVRTLHSKTKGRWRMWRFRTVRLEEKGGLCDVQWEDGTITRNVRFIVSMENVNERRERGTVYQHILNGEWYKAFNRGSGNVFEPMLVTEHHGTEILVPMRSVLVANVRQ